MSFLIPEISCANVNNKWASNCLFSDITLICENIIMQSPFVIVTVMNVQYDSNSMFICTCL